MKPPPTPDAAPPIGAPATRGPGALAAILAIVALAFAAGHAALVRLADLALVDREFALLARYAPRPATDPIIVVALDEAALAADAAPVALLHRTLGRAFAAIAAAGPRAVGVDIILPERSFDAIAPGGDAALAAGLLALRARAPVVLGVSTHADGALRAVHPPFLAAAGASGVALFPQDEDGRVRRYDDRFGARGEAVPTFTGELARALGATPRNGLVQYALGDGFDRVPLRRLLDLADAGQADAIGALLHDRVVLVGAVLPHDDRLPQPVPLARWEPEVLDAPGVLVHAQALRTALAGATVLPAPWPLGLALVLAGAALWIVESPRRRAAALVAYAIAALAASLVALRAGMLLPLPDMLRAAVAAFALRGALDLWRARRDRARLARVFGGYVSPGVLHDILAGRLDTRAAHRRTLAFLFADVRDFTTLSERTAPEAVLALLNRYFDAVAPAIHRERGTIDNFRGDGLMAVFGAPNALDDPASAAIRAARAMFAAVAALNAELAAAGDAPVAIGVTLALGDALVGNVGARDRYNYTALGDAANVAARLQDVAKSSGFALVATAAVVEAARGDAAHGWTPLGTVALRGHAPVVALGAQP